MGRSAMKNMVRYRQGNYRASYRSVTSTSKFDQQRAPDRCGSELRLGPTVHYAPYTWPGSGTANIC
jgi:hypothetical protein